MSVEGSALEQGVKDAIRSSASPESQGTPAHDYLKTTLEHRPIGEKLRDEIAVTATKLAGEGLGSSANSLRIVGDLNQLAVERYQGDLLNKARTPGSARAVLTEVRQLDPMHQVVTRNAGIRNIAQSSGLWNERPDNLFFFDVPKSYVSARHASNPEMIMVGGYWVNENTLKGVRDGLTPYHSFVEGGNITLPLAGVMILNRDSSTFQSAIPQAGVVECFTMTYAQYKELSDELNDPRQKKVPARSAQPEAQVPMPPASPVEIVAPVVEKVYSAEEYRVLNGEPNPLKMPAYKNVAELNAGGGTIKSPDHENQDRFLVDLPIKNSQGDQGEDVGRRYVLIDLAGGSLDKTGLAQAKKEEMFNSKAQAMTDLLGSPAHQTMNAREALLDLDRSASATRNVNPVYGGVLIVDVYEGSVFFAWKQDPALTTYRPSGYVHRRGMFYEQRGFDRGKQGDFQLQNLPRNYAHTFKAAGLRDLPTYKIPDDSNSSDVSDSVGDGKYTPPETLHLARPTGESTVFMLASDGVRADSSLIDPDKGGYLGKHYIDASARLLRQVMDGTRLPGDVAWQICTGANNIMEDDDDKTAIVVAVPPRK